MAVESSDDGFHPSLSCSATRSGKDQGCTLKGPGVHAERLGFVMPVPDMSQSVSFWEGLLGVKATFVDGDRWAQFDVGGSRLALAGRDWTPELPGTMIKVSALDQARNELTAKGLTVGDITRGEHELRCVARDPGGWPVVLYQSTGS